MYIYVYIYIYIQKFYLSLALMAFRNATSHWCGNAATFCKEPARQMGVRSTCRRPRPALRSAIAPDCPVREDNPHPAHSVAWCHPRSPRVSCAQSQSSARPRAAAMARRPLPTRRKSPPCYWRPRRLHAKKVKKNPRR
uniref:Uncharacterized protein n=1 Tax=Rhipicephalus pulchellus TaxID=72859 RepID=L7M135_RHIPC